MEETDLQKLMGDLRDWRETIFYSFRELQGAWLNDSWAGRIPCPYTIYWILVVLGFMYGYLNDLTTLLEAILDRVSGEGLDDEAIFYAWVRAGLVRT